MHTVLAAARGLGLLVGRAVQALHVSTCPGRGKGKGTRKNGSEKQQGIGVGASGGNHACNMANLRAQASLSSKERINCDLRFVASARKRERAEEKAAQWPLSSGRVGSTLGGASLCMAAHGDSHSRVAAHGASHSRVTEASPFWVAAHGASHFRVTQASPSRVAACEASPPWVAVVASPVALAPAFGAAALGAAAVGTGR